MEEGNQRKTRKVKSRKSINKEKSTNKKIVKKRKINNKKVPKENNKNTRNTKKKVLTTENILKFIFGLLLFVVIVLGIVVVKKSKEEKKIKNANIVIPIIEATQQSIVQINAENLEDKYIIRVSNYKDNKINKDVLEYSVNIINNTSSDVIVTKNDNNKNLMIDKNNTIIQKEQLKSNVKEDVFIILALKIKIVLKIKKILLLKLKASKLTFILSNAKIFIC